MTMPNDTIDESGRIALVKALEESSSYRLSYEDSDFLDSNDVRAVRMQLELLKPEHYLRRHHVHSTVVVFGSARLLPPSLARALVAFPGGYGTFDELFEALTLIQTGKIERIPVVLVGSEFWRRAVDFDFLVAEGMIDESERRLFSIVNTAEDAVAVLLDFYHGTPPPRS